MGNEILDNEITNQVKDEIRKKFISPFYSAFVFSWLVWNWELIFVIFFTDSALLYKKYFLLKNEYIQLLYHGIEQKILFFFVIPFLTAFFIVFYLSKIVTIFYKKDKDEQKERKIKDIKIQKEIMEKRRELYKKIQENQKIEKKIIEENKNIDSEKVLK